MEAHVHFHSTDLGLLNPKLRKSVQSLEEEPKTAGQQVEDDSNMSEEETIGETVQPEELVDFY